MRPVDRALGLYLALAPLALLLHPRPPAWPALALAHALAAAVLLRLPAPDRAPRGLDWVRWWHPLLLLPFLYAALPLLNGVAAGGPTHDTAIRAIEVRVFGGEPARTLAGALPWAAVSEPLHLAYVLYYPIVYVPPLVLWLAGRREAYAAALLAVVLAYVASWAVFLVLPVAGPRYAGVPPAVPDGPVRALALAILEAGSSKGTAFPSSHVSVAVAQAAAVARFAPRAGALLALLALLLALGAVYGGFHYATDAAAGALLGLAAAAAGRAHGAGGPAARDGSSAA